jgi:hypothetical protein
MCSRAPRAIRRSGGARGSCGATGGASRLLLLFVTLIALLLGPLCGTLMLFVTHASFHFINLVVSVIDAIVLPYAAIATTYLYFDLRLANQGQTADESVLPAESPATAS